MSIVTKAILKGYFETGDRPTEAQFIDLIDSIAILGTNTNDITFIYFVCVVLYFSDLLEFSVLCIFGTTRNF